MSRLPIRYAGWMARDLVLGPGVPIAGLAGLLTFFLVSARIDTNLIGGVQVILVGVLDLAAWLLALLATAGLVSADRAGGYHRTLFAHPVSPPLYYLQRWLFGGALVLAAASLAAAALAMRLQAPSVWPVIVGRAALVYLLLGGLVFLCSTLVRRDWLAAIAILAAHAVLGVLLSGPVARLLDLFFPPIGLLLPNRELPAGGDLLYVVLYGLALVVAALAVLGWRPLASGGRE